MREKLHPTLIELWIGIVIWSILITGAGIWFCKDKPAWGLGIAFGALTAFVLAFYMTRSVDKLIDDLDNGRGDRVIRVSSILRLVIAAAAIAIACLVPFFNPIGTFFGILSMKFAAYSNPLIHGVTKKMHPYFKDKEYPPEETLEEAAEQTAEEISKETAEQTADENNNQLKEEE